MCGNFLDDLHLVLFGNFEEAENEKCERCDISNDMQAKCAKNTEKLERKR